MRSGWWNNASSSGSNVLSHERPKVLLRSRLPFVVCAILLFVTAASAQTNVYTIRGNAGPGVTNNIWSVNPTTGVETLVYANFPGGNAATVAQRPSDGMIFYAINATNGAVYTFNPATPNVAPVNIGNLGLSTSGTNVSGGYRMAFSGNTLYYMIGNAGADANTVYTLNQSNGQATAIATVTGTLNGGDIAFIGNTLYIIDQDLRLCTYAGLPANGAAGGCNTLAIAGNRSIGLAVNSSGTLLLQTVNQGADTSGLYSITGGTTATFIAALSGNGQATGDMAGATVPSPNLSITKTDGLATVYRGGPVGYTIVVTNNGTYAVTGAVVDTLPATVTGMTWTCAASLPSFCGAASGAGNINTTVTLAAGASATYTLINGTLSAAASGNLVNTATVAVPSWLTDSVPANNTATDTDTINLNANLGITKTDGLANINPGSAITYTVVVSNAGPDASNGSIVTDTVPAIITGVNWTCGAVTGGATCGAASGAGNAISTTANLPSGSSVTYTISGTLATTATGTLSNTATVVAPAAGVTDPNDPSRTGAGNNSATDTTVVNPVADLRIAKSHAGNFTVGVNGTYTLTASNSGTLATSGTITVVDNLPAGLTIAALPTGTGWNCSTTVVGSSTATCTSATVIAAGATSPNPITVTVVVAPAAFPAVTNTATISGGGEPATMNGNNTVTDPTTVNGVADVRIAKSHAGNFTVGVNGTYTLTASNSGTLATSGTITVVDNLPAGLTIAALPTGTGWNCSTTVVGSSTATCTSATVIAAGATSPNPITVTVVVAPAAFPSVTNSATISGGGEPAYNNGNNTVTDPTTVNGVADVRIAKSHAGNFTVGVNGTYTLTASNSGTLATSGTITVVDNLPAGLTIAALPTGTGWNCSTTVVGSSTATCTSATVIAAGATSPNPITVTVVVAPAAFPSVTNAATISGGGEPAYNNGNNSVTDPTTVNGVADVRLAKSHAGNFTVGVNGTYTLTASNSGTLATSGTITVVDNLPAGLTIAALPTGTGWNCSTTVIGSSTATCTSATVIAAGATSPNPITVTVVVAAAAFPSVTNSATISGGGEPAYNNGNNTVTDPTTVNGVADLLIAKSHAGNFTVGVNGSYTLTASNSGTGATSGTITVIDNLPAGLTIAALPTGTGWNCSTTVIGSSTATCTSATVIAAGATSPNPITVTVVVAPAAFPSVINAATISGGGEPAYNNGNNTVTDPTTVNGVADLRIAKSHAGNFTVGVNGTYTLTASNSGTLASSGTITVVDNLPAGLTIAALPTGTGWNCSTTVIGSSTATCTSATVIGAGATSPNPISVTVVVASAAFPSVTNSATISGGGEPAYNNGNNSITDPTTVNGVADLTIAKSHSGNFTVGVNGTYTLTAGNSGTLATSGTITVVDNLPAGLTIAALPTGTGWNCSTTVVGSSTATCTSATVIAAGATSPNPITVTVVVAAAAFPSVTNAATISGGGEPAYNNGNNSVTDPTTVNGVADLRIAKSHAGNFTVGVNGTYTLTASNSGTGATSGTITVIDNLPAGLTIAALPTGTGWNCSTTVVGSSTATCTSATVIAAGATSPNPITVTVVVAPAAFPSVINAATISGGGEPAYNNGNNSITDPTTVNGVADVRLAKSHAGNFTVGVNGTYTLTASNSGTLATSGTITVVDNLPAGLTIAALPTGTGWNCSTTVVGSSTATCTSATVIAAGATSPNPITVTVVVAPAAFPSVTNSATISGGGEPAYNNGNNTVTDPTTVNGVSDLTIAKSHAGNFTQGQTGAPYSITVTNSGTAVTSGTVTVIDTLPSGLTIAAIPTGTGWNCSTTVVGSSTATCTRSDALAVGASYPVITLTVDVSLTAPASVTNSVTVSGGGENNASNNTANDPTTINAAAPPNVRLDKSVNPGGTQDPGTDLLYTIVYTNIGGQPAKNLIVVDPNPANVVPAERVFHNVDFKVGSLTSSPGSSGLVATFQYSNDGGTTWTYVPVSGAGGAPAGYDRFVTNVRWSFAGNLSQTAPNNTGSVTLTVRIP